MAMGVVDKFSWKDVAVGGLTAAVSAGVGHIAKGAVNAPSWARTAVGAMKETNAIGYASRGVFNYASSQVINRVVGLDTSFNWRGLAASAVGNTVGGYSSGVIGTKGLSNAIISGQVSAHSSAAIRDKWFGGDRPSYGQIAADAFGNSLVNAALDLVEPNKEALIAAAMLSDSLSSAGVSWEEREAYLSTPEARLFIDQSSVLLKHQQDTGKSFDELTLQQQAELLDEVWGGEGRVEMGPLMVLGRNGQWVPIAASSNAGNTSANLKSRVVEGSAEFLRTTANAINAAESRFGETVTLATMTTFQALVGGIPRTLTSMGLNAAIGDEIEAVKNALFIKPLSGFIAEVGFEISADDTPAERQDIQLVSDTASALAVEFGLGNAKAVLLAARRSISPSDIVLGGESAGAVKGPYRGGPHRETILPRNDGLDSHHTPDRNADPLVHPNDGPAIQMDPRDHGATSSNGQRGRAGLIYRAESADMISTGRYRDAMAREIHDVRRAAAEISGSRTKYNEATREMLDYARKSGQLPANPRTGR